MMHYKYRFEIETLTPLHIGTGEVYEPTNFVIDSGNLYEFDEMLFLKGLPLIEKNAFNRMIERRDYFQIIGFYKKHVKYAKQIAYAQIPVSKRVEEKYNTIFNKDGSLNKNRLEIQKTYKAPNTHRAVIPGSSIKGMLDTVFGIYPQKIRENRPRQALKVSDALMVEGGTQIGYSYRRHKNPEKSAKSAIPQIVEIITRGTKFVVTIETRWKLKELISKFQAYYQQSERESHYFQTTSSSFVARIGKFSGKPFMVDDGETVRNSYGKKVATHTLYEDNTPFGWVMFHHIEEETYRTRLDRIDSEQNAYYQALQERQKEIITRIEKSKEEAKRLKEEKEAQALALQQEKEEAERKKQEALAQMSPLERKIQPLFDAEPNTPQTTVLLKAIERGTIEEICEALHYLKKLMIASKEWKEKTTAKKPQKDKAYQKTLKVLERLKQC